MYSAILYDSIVFMYSHLLPAGFCSSSDLSTCSESVSTSVFLTFSSICSELSTGFSTISTSSGIALVQFSSSCCPALIKSLRISGVLPASGSISGKSFSTSICPGMSFGSSTGFSVSCFSGFFGFGGFAFTTFDSFLFSFFGCTGAICSFSGYCCPKRSSQFFFASSCSVMSTRYPTMSPHVNFSFNPCLTTCSITSSFSSFRYNMILP